MSDVGDIYLRYRGLSREDASREGARLVAEAHRTGNWHAIVDQLFALRSLMQMHDRIA